MTRWQDEVYSRQLVFLLKLVKDSLSTTMQHGRLLLFLGSSTSHEHISWGSLYVFCGFWSSKMSFCSFIARRHIRLKWPNVTYIGDQEARYRNWKVQFFHEITDLWAKSLTVYLICDNGEHKARKEYRITQINKDYHFAWEQLTRFRISYHAKFKVCPPHCIVVDRESLTIHQQIQCTSRYFWYCNYSSI